MPCGRAGRSGSQAAFGTSRSSSATAAGTWGHLRAPWHFVYTSRLASNLSCALQDARCLRRKLYSHPRWTACVMSMTDSSRSTEPKRSAAGWCNTSNGELVERFIPSEPVARKVIEINYLPLYLAERVGFEPTVGSTTPVFKTGALNRSAISPNFASLLRCRGDADLTPGVLDCSGQRGCAAAFAWLLPRSQDQCPNRLATFRHREYSPILL